jgi:uncharacterized membrane protein YsdA (DUF1294 family)/cold shock CspA family protein
MPSLSPPPTSASAGVIRSRIVEWDASRGFGFVDHGGKRLFLHYRDFVRRDHRPRPGDGVSFVVGTDGRGRACAKSVESLKHRGQLRGWHGIVLFVLLIVPALAVWSLPWSLWVSLGYLVVVSGLSYRAYRDDKNRAQQGGPRRSESSLHFLDLLGGWPGGYLAQHQFRHKTAKASFRRVFRGTLLLHEAVALDYLLGWPGLRRFLELIAEFISRLPA